MIKKTVTYTDWDGEQVTEDLYFNLNKAEMMELNKRYNGALDKYLKRAQERKQYVKLGVFYKDLILKAYGVKSTDGKRFEKSEEAARDFFQSVAFDTLFDEVLESPEAAEALVNGMLNGIRGGSESEERRAEIKALRSGDEAGA